MGTKNKIYSWTLQEKVNARIPEQIREAAANKGWNVFGIFEVVREELRKERRSRNFKLTRKEG